MKKIALILIFIFNTNLNADTLKDINEIKDLTEKIMTFVGKGETIKGLDLMSPYLIIPKSEFETTKNQLAMQEPIYKSRFGKTLGVEHISTEEVGESLIKIIYIHKFEKHVMKWSFYYYKPNDLWILNTFRTIDRIDLLFKT